MPTTRPRIMVTETDDVAEALDIGAEAFPEARSRSELLRQMLLLGAEQIKERRTDRARTVRNLAGAFSDLYPDGYLDELREEWPE